MTDGEKVYVTIPIDPVAPLTAPEAALMVGHDIEVVLRKRKGDTFVFPLAGGLIESVKVEDIEDPQVRQVLKVVFIPEDESVSETQVQIARGDN